MLEDKLNEMKLHEMRYLLKMSLRLLNLNKGHSILLLLTLSALR